MTHPALVRLLLALLAVGAAAAPASAQFVEPDVSVLYRLDGERASDNFGWVAEVIGDIDGDGAPDFVIGAPANAAGGPAAGRAYVYSGATGALLHTVTGAPGNRIGFSVAGAGDVDLDGVPDYIVGGPGLLGGPAGTVLLISGATHDVLWQAFGPANAFFGFDVNRAGDVDGDGRPDVIVGASRDSARVTVGGSATVLSGADGAPIWTRYGTQIFGFFGAGVSGVDDLDGDGVPEQVVGAFRDGSHNQGQAYVFSGATATLLYELHPNGTGTSFGAFFVHDAGDVDGDGVGDIYIGDTGDGSRNAGSEVFFQGRGYVFSGATGERVRTLDGENVGDGFGIGRGAGDVDGDGHADLIVAAWRESSAAPLAGKAYLVSGKNGKTMRTFTGTIAGAELGFDVVALGDVSGDALPDYLITGAGVAYVVLGR